MWRGGRNMRLASLLNNRFTEFEARKKLVTLKNVDDAYKKQAKYFTPTANPSLEELVNLLTGKKEKEDHSNLQESLQHLQQRATIEENQGTTQSPTEMMLQDDVTVHLLPETGLPKPLPVQLKDAKQMTKERLTEKALATYQFQMSMARGGFKVLEPMIYCTA